MATKNYTTKTASLRATKIDTNKIELKGKNILDYISENKTTILDERGTNVTENDLWGTTITTDENGVVTVSCKNVTNPNASNGSCWNKDINLVRDNKAYTGDVDSFYGTVSNLAFVANIQTEKIVDGSCMFYLTDLAEFDSDLSSLSNGSDMFGGSKISYFNIASLSSLTNGKNMFHACLELVEFDSELSSLSNGNAMFYGCNKLTYFNIASLSSLTNGNEMFADCTSLYSFTGDLSSLINGDGMFYKTALASFSSNLSSLIYGKEMFFSTFLTRFNSDLSSLTNGDSMFYNCTNLTRFNSDLSSLTNGRYMFHNNKLTSFDSDLSSLVDGYFMFHNNKFTSFDSDLSNLTNGDSMFSGCTNLKTFTSDLSNLTNGVDMFYCCTALTTFQGNLGSLLGGTRMFDTPKLDIESIEYIADGIRDLAAEELVISSDGGKTWTIDTSTEEKYNIWNNISSSSDRAQIFIGFNSELYPIGSEGEAKIFALCNEMVSKGWRIYLNGYTYVPTDDATTTSLDGEMTTTPISYWYKPVAVEEEYASYVDANGNYFNIVGAQYVFGDDISTYGQFTSLEAAEMAMGLTKYIRPEVEDKE